jgi:hypothetical protein
MSVSGIRSTPNSADLLAILRQQYLAKQASSASNVSSLLDDGGGSQGSTPASSSTAGTTPAATTTGSGTNPLSQTIIAVLIEAQGQQSSGTGNAADPSSFGQKLFNSVDTNGDGQINQPELESAVTTGGGTASQADAFFSKLDRNGDGSVSKGELTAGLQAHHGQHHHGAPAGGSGSGDPLAALLQAMDGSTAADGTAQSATGADGSTTTTLTYADGTKVTLTVPATSAVASASDGTVSTDGVASNPAPSKPESLLMTLIRLQEQAFQAGDSTGQAVTSLAA